MIRRTDERSLISAEMHFVWQDVEYSLSDHERNEEIMREIQIPQMLEFMEQYGRNCMEHIFRMSSDRKGL
jgi:hypothetical protein